MSNKDKHILHSVRENGMVNVGHGNFVIGNRIVAVLETGPLPVRRLREQAHKEQRLLDASGGRKMRSLLVTDSNHVVISGLAPGTILERIHKGSASRSMAELELSDGEFVS